MSDDLEERLAEAAPVPTHTLDFDRVLAKTQSLRYGRRAAGAALLGLAGLCTVAVVRVAGVPAPVQVGPDPMGPSPTSPPPTVSPTASATQARPALDCPDQADEVARNEINPGPHSQRGVPELVSARAASAAEVVAWRSRAMPTDGGLPPVTLSAPEFLVDAPKDASAWVCIYWSEDGFGVPEQGADMPYLVVAALEYGPAEILEAHPEPPTGKALGPNAGPDAKLPEWHTAAPSAPNDVP
jgi:hypothetical protein